MRIVSAQLFRHLAGRIWIDRGTLGKSSFISSAGNGGHILALDAYKPPVVCPGTFPRRPVYLHEDDMADAFGYPPGLCMLVRCVIAWG